MADLLDAVEERLARIATKGHGAGLSPIATQRALPPDQFRCALHGAPLDDPQFPPGAFDRAVDFDWLTLRDRTPPTNDINPHGQLLARVDVVQGFVFGDGMANFVYRAPGTSEDPALAVRRVKRRALGEAERLRMALCWFEMWPGTDPVIESVHREADSLVQVVGPGRLVVRSRYLVQLQRDNTKSYASANGLAP